MIFNQKCQDF